MLVGIGNTTNKNRARNKNRENNWLIGLWLSSGVKV
jgi:hypothetical protein